MRKRILFSTIAIILSAAPSAFADDPLTMFTNHFGDDVKRVRATKDTADDAELAKKIIEETPGITADPKIQTLFFNKAYDLGIAGPEGFDACDHALAKLTEVAPDQKASIDERWLMVSERRLRQASISVDEREALLGKHLAKLDEIAGGKIADKKFEEAVSVYSKGVALFGSTNSPLPERINRVKAAQVANNKVTSAKAKIKAKPDDASANRDLALLYMIDFDQPAEAAKYAPASGEPALIEVVTLASGDVAALDGAKLIKLGDWYRNAGEKASEVGKPNVYTRAQGYYGRVAEVAGATEPQKDKAKLALELLAKLNAPPELKAVANDTTSPQYIRVVAWDGTEPRRATARATGAATLGVELTWPDSKSARAAAGYEFTHVRKLGFVVDEMKFELDEESAVAVVIDYHTKAGYTSRAVLVLGGKPQKLSVPVLHTIGLHREEVTIIGDGKRFNPPFQPRDGRAPMIRTGPNGVMMSVTREPGAADTGSYESSDDMASNIRRGIDVRTPANGDTVIKLADQASFQFELKNWAPKDWDNQVWFQLVAVNPKNSGSRIRAHFDLPGYRPKK